MFLARHVLPAALLFALSTASRCQQAPEPAAPAPQVLEAAPGAAGAAAGQAQAVKPRNSAGNRKLESVITDIQEAPDSIRLTLQNGAVSFVVRKPLTQVVQEERGVLAPELKVGDTLSLITLRPSDKIKRRSVVTALAPLTLNIEGIGSLAVSTPEAVEFSRETPLPNNTLSKGPTVAVDLRVHADGGIDVLRIAVIIAKPKAAKPRARSRRKAAPKAAAPEAAPRA